MPLGIPPNPWPVHPNAPGAGVGMIASSYKVTGLSSGYFLGRSVPCSGSPGDQRAVCAGRKKRLLSQMGTSIQKQKIQLGSFSAYFLNYRLHLWEGWAELPSCHRKGRLVLAPGIPAAMRGTGSPRQVGALGELLVPCRQAQLCSFHHQVACWLPGSPKTL